MTGFRVEPIHFTSGQVDAWGRLDPKHRNWPVVYALDDESRVYVGQTSSALSRLRQHLANDEKRTLTRARIVIDDEFNQSVCLDLESHLIGWFAGEGRLSPLNGNGGMSGSDYFDRARYREMFRDVFEALRSEGLFSHDIEWIQNQDLFKLSPFKALTDDQRVAVFDLLSGLFDRIERGTGSTSVIEGGPGTGKTIVAIFLMKMLADIRDAGAGDEPPEGDSLFADFFLEGYRELLAGFRMALVVPQQSLRASVQRVFRKTPGLSPDMVKTPFQVGESPEPFDLLIVDEAHRLGQRAAQPFPALNTKFVAINERLFGGDDRAITQLDWIRAQSTHRLLLLDREQSIRPSDLPSRALDGLIATARTDHSHYALTTQMRVRAGEDYIGYARALVSNTPPATRRYFADYELALFDDFGAMQDAIVAKDRSEGLARCVAGFAWPWRTKDLNGDPSVYDIELDGRRLRWNVRAVDWINSRGSLHEMGSIHTVQGYDLNYAGVVIGPDLRLDARSGQLRIDRASYFDTRGKANNGMLGITYSDDDLLVYIANIYGVLLTRGIRGTYVYVCDPALRARFRQLMPSR